MSMVKAKMKYEEITPTFGIEIDPDLLLKLNKFFNHWISAYVSQLYDDNHMFITLFVSDMKVLLCILLCE